MSEKPLPHIELNSNLPENLCPKKFEITQKNTTILGNLLAILGRKGSEATKKIFTGVTK